MYWLKDTSSIYVINMEIIVNILYIVQNWLQSYMHIYLFTARMICILRNNATFNSRGEIAAKWNWDKFMFNRIFFFKWIEMWARTLRCIFFAFRNSHVNTKTYLASFMFTNRLKNRFNGKLPCLEAKGQIILGYANITGRLNYMECRNAQRLHLHYKSEQTRQINSIKSK